MTAWVKKVNPALALFFRARNAVSRAADATDLPLLRTDLVRVGKTAARMEAIPMPRCADTGGYYAKWLDRFVAVGDNARSQGGLSGIELAEEPLKGAPALLRKLNAELDRAGYTRL